MRTSVFAILAAISLQSFAMSSTTAVKADVENQTNWNSIDDHHAPIATSDDGCLVISWVKNRLNFLPGIFSPLNRLFWWYLKKT